VSIRTFQEYPAATQVPTDEECRRYFPDDQRDGCCDRCAGQPKHADEENTGDDLDGRAQDQQAAAPRSCSVIVVTDNCDRLIREMSIANPRREAPRIHGEFLMLGINIGKTSVAEFYPHSCRRLWICLSCRSLVSFALWFIDHGGGRFDGLAAWANFATISATQIVRRKQAKRIAQCDAINHALSVCRHMANAARVVRLLIASF